MKMRIFSTEIEGSGWPLVFWVFVFFKFLRPQSLAWFSISTSSFVKWKSFILFLNHPNKKKKLFIS